MEIFWTMLASTGVLSLIISMLFERHSIDVSNRSGYRKTVIFLMITLSVVIFFAAMRSYVSDTGAYVSFYYQIPTSMTDFGAYVASREKDPIFWALSMVFKCFISSSFHAWFFAISFVCCLGLCCTVARYSEMPFLSVFMFVLACHFTWLFNGMRQFLAVCLVFWAFRYFVERRTLPALAICVLASCMHATAFISIPAYFIVQGAAGNKKVVLSMFATVVFVVGLSSILPFADDLLAGSAYGDVISQFSQDDGVNPIRILITAVPSVLFFALKRRVDKEPPTYVNIAVNMSIFAMLLNIVGKFTSGIYIGRMSIYFELANLLLYPWIFKHEIAKRTKAFFILAYLTCYFIYFYYQMVITWDGFGYVSDILGISFR